jgi:hypothetical protein
MSSIVRTILALFLVLVFSFCVFGFVSTFEPLPRSVQWTWRTVYCGVGLTSLGVAMWLIGRHRVGHVGFAISSLAVVCGIFWAWLGVMRVDPRNVDMPLRVVVAFSGWGLMAGPLGLIVSLIGLAFRPRRAAVYGVILGSLSVSLLWLVGFLFLSF